MALAGCDDSPAASPHTAPASAAPGAVADHELAAATSLARDEIRLRDAVVTRATVTVSRGVGPNPNLGKPCTSGRLLHLTLVGTFPHVVTTGTAGGGAPTVRALLVTADAASGVACLVGVQTSEVAPEPGAVVLSLE